MGHLSLEKIGKCIKMCQALPLELQGPLASGTPQASCCEQNQTKSVLKCRCEDCFCKMRFRTIMCFQNLSSYSGDAVCAPSLLCSRASCACSACKRIASERDRVPWLFRARSINVEGRCLRYQQVAVSTHAQGHCISRCQISTLRLCQA